MSGAILDTHPVQNPLALIPLSILTGFLGSGKTTRLNTWLKDPAFSDTLVIINEFGDIGLDHQLIEEAPGDVILMAAGCLCCSVRGDLVATLEDLLRRRDNNRIRFFRRVIIETTGLADPLPVLHTVMQHPYLSKRFAISGILTLVDAVHGAQTLHAHEDAQRQVALADAIILTKTDLVDAGTLEAAQTAIRLLNPHAPMLDGDEAASPEALLAPRFDPAKLDEIQLQAWLGNTATSPNPHGHASKSDGAINTFAFLSEQHVSEAQLIVFREAMRIMHGPKLLRMKGLIALKEDPDHPVVIHHVQSIAHPPVKLARWPTRDQRTKLVFITQSIARETIEGFWNALVKA